MHSIFFNKYLCNRRRKGIYMHKEEVYICSCQSFNLAGIPYKLFWSFFSTEAVGIVCRLMGIVSAVRRVFCFLFYEYPLFCLYRVIARGNVVRMGWLHVTAILITWNNTYKRLYVLAAYMSWCNVNGWVLQCLHL